MYLPIDYVLFLLYSYGPLMSMIMSSVQAAPRPDVRFVAPHRSPGLVRPPFSKVRATKYLREYGWLPKPSQTGYGKDSLVTREEYEDALRAFQRFASLQETGVLDDQTIVKMLEPRCGVKDVDEDGISPMQERRHLKGGRYKRYTIEGSYWGVKKIKYRIKKYTRNMDRNKVSKVIRKSFKVWEEASPLRFIETNDKDDSVHINVMFVRRAHGDGEPFDGRGQILAHAFFPRYGGDVHFDEEEPWSTPGARAKQLPRRQQRRGRHNIWWRIKKILNGDIDNTIPQEGIDLYSVAAHEIGHSLGLKHSDNHHALMAPFYQGYTGDAIHLHKDDIKGLQHLYGYHHKACDCSGKTTYCTENLCGCMTYEGWCSDEFSDEEIASLSDVRRVRNFDVPIEGVTSRRITLATTKPPTTTKRPKKPKFRRYKGLKPRKLYDPSGSRGNYRPRSRLFKDAPRDYTRNRPLPSSTSEQKGYWGHSQVNIRGIGKRSV